MYMVMFVLDDPDRLDEVLLAWEGAGVQGATIIESTGYNRRKWARQVGTPMMAGFNRLLQGSQEGHYTLFSLVRNEATVAACVAATEAVVGSLDGPNTGVLAAWPLSIVHGLPAED